MERTAAGKVAAVEVVGPLNRKFATPKLPATTNLTSFKRLLLCIKKLLVEIDFSALAIKNR